MTPDLLKEQEKKLLNLSKEDYHSLFRLYQAISTADMKSEWVSPFVEKLYELGVVFAFDWSNWTIGKNAIVQAKDDFKDADLLTISMYLTTIVRGDRFNEGLLARTIQSGMLDKLMAAMQQRVAEWR